MPDFVLNVSFNNPSLPVIQIPGIRDAFNRTAGSLGVSDNGRAWESIGTDGVGTWITDGANAGISALSAGSAYAIADALASNGRLSTTIAAIGSAAGGLALRVASATTLLRVAFRQSAGVNRLVLTDVVGGTNTTLGVSASTKLTAAGSVVEVILNGNQITVTLGGETVIGPVVSNVPTTGTKFGMYGTPNDFALRFGNLDFYAA